MKGQDWNRLFRNGIYVYNTPDRIVAGFAKKFMKDGYSRLFDAGCGYGRNIPPFVSRGAYVVGVDYSNFALELARSRLSCLMKNVVLMKHPLTSLPFMNESFDAALCLRVLQHNTKKARHRIVRELWRVTREGGEVLASVASTSHPEFGSGRQVERNTFCTPGGDREGVLRHYFGEREVRFLFRKFRIEDLKLQSSKTHWVISLRKV